MNEKNNSDFKNKKRNSVIDATNLSCKVVLNLTWFSKFSLMCEHFRLKFEFDVPCSLQNGFLSRSASCT